MTSGNTERKNATNHLVRLRGDSFESTHGNNDCYVQRESDAVKIPDLKPRASSTPDTVPTCYDRNRSSAVFIVLRCCSNQLQPRHCTPNAACGIAVLAIHFSASCYESLNPLPQRDRRFQIPTWHQRTQMDSRSCNHAFFRC